MACYNCGQKGHLARSVGPCSALGSGQTSTHRLRDYEVEKGTVSLLTKVMTYIRYG